MILLELASDIHMPAMNALHFGCVYFWSVYGWQGYNQRWLGKPTLETNPHTLVF